MTDNRKLLTGSSTEGNYRFPGSRPFYDTEVDRCLFFGREQESQLLLHKTLNWDIVVLYAKSGLGKTSLINAGLNQELRDRGYMPITVRMNNPDIADPLPAFFQGIKDFAARENLDYEHGEEDSLWQFFRTSFFWGKGNEKLKPVVILDQFEEFFTSYSRKKRKTFIRNLADLVNNTAPGELLASFPPGQKLPYSLDPPGVKIIISIREDFLGQLEEMSKNIPVILNHRFRLMPLTRQQAKQAIIEPSQVRHEAIRADSFTFTPEAVGMLLDFLCKKRERDEIKTSDDVEPFQLQILCRYFEDKSCEKDKKNEGEVTIEKEDLGGEKGMLKVLQQFYEEQLKKLGTFFKRKRVRRLFEKGLISFDDRRVIRDEGEIIRVYKVSKSLLTELIHMRLIRSEPRVGSIYYELSHDTMVEPIRQSQKKRNTKNKRIGFGFLLIVIFTIGLNWSQIQKKITELTNKFEYIITDINRLMKNAKELERKDEDKEAIKIYEKILTIDKTEVNAYLGKGKLHLKAGEYYKTIDIFEIAINNGIQNGLIYLNLGDAYLKTNNTEKAHACYENSIGITSHLAIAFERIGDIYQDMNHLNSAIEYYEKALTINNKKTDVYKKLILSYINIKNNGHDKAIKIFKMAIKNNQENVYIYRDISEILIKSDRKYLAKKIYDISHKNMLENDRFRTDLGHDYYNLGVSFLNNGKHNDAIDALNKATEIKKDISNAYDLMGYILMNQEKYNIAIKSYQKAVEIAPKNRRFILNLIEAYFVAGHFEEASFESEKLLRSKYILKEEDILSLRFIYISSLLFQEKHQEAFNSIEKFIGYYGSIRKNYEKNWNYALIKRFLRKNTNLPKQHLQILFIIIDILESNKEGDKKIEQLQSFIR